MMKKEIVKEIIRDFHQSSLPEIKKRDIEIPIDTGKIITLSGVRRSGKTFILFEIINRLFLHKHPKEKILYINFEDERIELRKNELDFILRGYQELYPNLSLSECYFFFDEIQNLEGWEKFIRRIYDTATKNIFITGSNSRFLSKEIATSLRGRTITYEIFPLSFNEYLRFHNVDTDLYHSQTRAKIVNLFEKYLFEGGFPELVVFEDKSLKNRILQEYFEVMLYRDLIERFNITNSVVLKYFIKRVFENIAKPISVNNIFHELKSAGYKIGKNSLYEYLDEAVSAYLFLVEKKYDQSVLKQELGEKKVYAIDNGLLNAVTFKFSQDYGKLLENLIFIQIYNSGTDVFFYKNKRECDFIVAKSSSVGSVLQVSYSIADSQTKQRELSGLIEVCKKFKLKEGHIITFSEEQELRQDGISIKVLPAYKFLLTRYGNIAL